MADEEILFNRTMQGCFEDTCAGWLFPFCSGYNNEVLAPTSVQKVEPKVFVANERTFLHWLHAGVTLYTIAAGILAFASDTHSVSAHWYAMASANSPSRTHSQSIAPSRPPSPKHV